MAWKPVELSPEHRTGVPDDALLRALMHGLASVANRRCDLWQGVRILVSHDGRLAVTICNRDTGTEETTYYKLRKDGPPLMWIPDK